VGGALYERVREEARQLGGLGLFFECLPDDPAECSTPEILKQNIARLKFYERYGARPIVNTSYELPIKPGVGDCRIWFTTAWASLPAAMQGRRKIVRAILERKYSELCQPDYVEKVIQSFRDDPVRLRDFRYTKTPGVQTVNETRHSIDRTIALVINDKHEIHHVRDRGYVESPVRIKSIFSELGQWSAFQRIEPRNFPERYLKSVHDGDFVDYLKKCCTSLKTSKSVYPYVFPIRNAARPPKELAVRAGYYCIDTFTPLNRNAYDAAKRSVDCALTGAHLILGGYRYAYALVRPRASCGATGVWRFCYFNSIAIAAHYLSQYGKVAVLDIDYHHGNGTQDIFYDRADVLTVSIHGHPRFAYPYFSGFEDETGTGPGWGITSTTRCPNRWTGPDTGNPGKGPEADSESQPDFLALALSRSRQRRSDRDLEFAGEGLFSQWEDDWGAEPAGLNRSGGGI
jgi:acetoin utilization deacetylase AcuC-like enzyme